MSVAGFCEICQKPDVDGTCDRCGKLVCDEHFDESTGYCVECVVEVQRGRDDGGGDREPDEYPDGVDTYRS